MKHIGNLDIKKQYFCVSSARFARDNSYCVRNHSRSKPPSFLAHSISFLDIFLALEIELLPSGQIPFIILFTLISLELWKCPFYFELSQ